MQLSIISTLYLLGIDFIISFSLLLYLSSLRWTKVIPLLKKTMLNLFKNWFEAKAFDSIATMSEKFSNSLIFFMIIAVYNSPKSVFVSGFCFFVFGDRKE